ncbi:hypothetical protein Bbelb_203630 [Branchiostoma belcheri]|nr:hypothetical protein Bbelb_203630 [Branchiostoma belcheri]
MYSGDCFKFTTAKQHNLGRFIATDVQYKVTNTMRTSKVNKIHRSRLRCDATTEGQQERVGSGHGQVRVPGKRKFVTPGEYRGVLLSTGLLGEPRYFPINVRSFSPSLSRPGGRQECLAQMVWACDAKTSKHLYKAYHREFQNPRPRGRPPKKWKDQIQSDTGLTLREAETIALDRAGWKYLTEGSKGPVHIGSHDGGSNRFISGDSRRSPKVGRTCHTAEGKATVTRQRGKPLPHIWLNTAFPKTNRTQVDVQLVAVSVSVDRSMWEMRRTDNKTLPQCTALCKPQIRAKLLMTPARDGRFHQQTIVRAISPVTHRN